ncbi:4-(cytidine 5'-diphospho)-2-C-methyl-D-erythritol kinase [Nocardioides sp. BP30]|uniref:4-(cytidine 5'-diphospho)-2-C-methyl-D-erythritol kinase n=1 Tax=Nocardioides sp. BP30 TaxID=3036374 RepID=UPI002469AB76|nr:4-(cytidine 5'-diphospho)-2-C-methyl-D-erythritol kinase [Nocardioides sp. BP30]WGL51840.1 4-(cytidine 5'-diphospho)-2-C-methyl-D-erythritol kinase [Nocardioides sp. BP30]
MTVTVRAAAKINLHLGVGPVRADGFHPLATVYQAVGLYDDVLVADAEEWVVTVTGEAHVALAEVPQDGSNIAIRAGRALAAHHSIDRAARIEIHKGIPVAGGLAGGSADAAATLLALDRLWSLGTTDEDLLRIAGELGSDVPFALLGGAAAGHGRGELVEPLEDHGAWWWVVVGNAVGLSTPAVYRHFDELTPAATDPVIPDSLVEALRNGDLELLAASVGNDLQEPALDLRADLRRTFADGAEAGALATLLSGSGPTVLLLCRDAAHAREIAGAMQAAGHEHCWAVPAPVAGAHVVSYD